MYVVGSKIARVTELGIPKTNRNVQCLQFAVIMTRDMIRLQVLDAVGEKVECVQYLRYLAVGVPLEENVRRNISQAVHLNTCILR